MSASFSKIKTIYRTAKNSFFPPKKIVSLEWKCPQGRVHMAAHRMAQSSRGNPLYALSTITTTRRWKARNINPQAFMRDQQMVEEASAEAFERDGQSTFSLQEAIDILSTFDGEQSDRSAPERDQMLAVPNHYVHYAPHF